MVERTVSELNGIACLDWTTHGGEVKPAKQEVFSTRSFGQRITDKNNLHMALAKHASIVAKKYQAATLISD